MVAIAPVTLAPAQLARMDEKKLTDLLQKGKGFSDPGVQKILERLSADQQKDKKIKLNPAIQAMVQMLEDKDQVGGALDALPTQKPSDATSTSSAPKSASDADAGG